MGKSMTMQQETGLHFSSFLLVCYDRSIWCVRVIIAT
jgi:hypothetical protein